MNEIDQVFSLQNKIFEASYKYKLALIGTVAIVIGCALMVLLCTTGKDVGAKSDLLKNPITLGVMVGCFTASSLATLFFYINLKKLLTPLATKHISEIEFSVIKG